MVGAARINNIKSKSGSEEVCDMVGTQDLYQLAGEQPPPTPCSLLYPGDGKHKTKISEQFTWWYKFNIRI